MSAHWAGYPGLDRPLSQSHHQMGLTVDTPDNGWATFASNVGKERIQRREAIEQRLRWVGAVVLVAMVAVARLPYCSLRWGPRRLVEFGCPCPGES